MTLPHRKRRKSFDEPGDVHFLTFSCFQRLPLLNRDRSRMWMVDALRLGLKKDRFHLLAWVIMPEHVHLILVPVGDTKVSSILTTLKQSVSKRALLWLKNNSPEFLKQLKDTQPSGRTFYRFWQRGGGYDRNLRSVRDLHEKIRYVHENPERRRLCNRAIDWKWSSARTWATGEDDLIPIARHLVPSLSGFDDVGGTLLGG